MPGNAPDRAEVEVVVVGAGAAGLAATRLLLEASVSVTLLEARSRIGGRAHTVLLGGGVPVDCGCGWLHSANRNEWVGLAGGLGLTVDSKPSPWSRQFADLGFTQADQAAFHEASDRFYARIEAAALRGEEGAAADWLEPGNRWNPLIDAVSTYYNGVEFASVSIQDFHRYVDTERNWRVREGFGAAVQAFGADLPVRLDCPVTTIDHGGRLLRLETPDGTVEATHAIVTVPPTVLLGGGLRFTPELPAKVAAAAGLPLGLANKTFLAVTAPDALPADAHVFGRPDRTDTASYHLRPFGRPVIEGYFGGACAAELERAGPDAFTAFALDELAGLFGTRIRQQVKPLVSTAWRSDPWSLGAYSHALPGHADDRATWAAPVDGRLFFAGEACSREDFSTAHGAYRTGRAAATALLSGLG